MNAPELNKKYNVSVYLIIILVTIVASATYTYHNITTTQKDNSTKLLLLEKSLMEKNDDILKKLDIEKMSYVVDKNRIIKLEREVEDLKRKYWIGYRKRKELENSIMYIESDTIMSR